MTKSRRNTIIDRNYNSNEYENLPYYDTDEKNIRFVRITEENGIDNGMTLYFVTSKEASLRSVFKLLRQTRVLIGSNLVTDSLAVSRSHHQLNNHLKTTQILE